jgi:hypothetical protein
VVGARASRRRVSRAFSHRRTLAGETPALRVEGGDSPVECGVCGSSRREAFGLRQPSGALRRVGGGCSGSDSKPQQPG